MDIFGKDFETWIHLDRYGNYNKIADIQDITAFINSPDCKVEHVNYIMNGE